MSMLAEDDPAFGRVRDRAKAEESDIGLAALRVLCRAGAAIFAENVDNPGDAPIRSGRLLEFQKGAEERVTPVARDAGECEKAATASFKVVWRAAKQLLATESAAPELCPVCVPTLDQNLAGPPPALRLPVETHPAA